MRPIDILTGGRHSAEIAAMTCTWCKKDVFGFKDELSRTEYGISGLCQECQDAVFVDQEDFTEEYEDDA